jgi:hypothetical protein
MLRIDRKGQKCGSFVLSLLLWIGSMPASAQYRGEPLPEKLSITASLRTRWELWNWFEPTGTQDNDYDFLATVTRVGAAWTDDDFDIVVEAPLP